MNHTSHTASCDVLVIGAGAIGLAVAEELSKTHQVVLVETHDGFGRETSSRNSEVIHSGIYYPTQSFKTKWCIEGQRLLYSFCDREGVPYRKTGKMVVGTNSSEREYLDKLADHCQTLGIPHRSLTAREVSDLEPAIAAEMGVLFPETGILDTHSFLATLERKLTERGGVAGYRHKVIGLRRDGASWHAALDCPQGLISIQSQFVVNAAGLGAAELSCLALETDDYEHHFCRGAYFQLSSEYRGKFHHLIYPVPSKDGLGIHVTIDLAGYVRLGPDVEWCQAVHYAELGPWYDADWEARRVDFVTATRRYFPLLRAESLNPGFVGIRPKLFVRGTANTDFLVEDKGNFIHCLGIESPGLTASLAIANAVRAFIERGTHG